YEPITFEAFHAGMVQIGGAFIADVFTAIARETLDGRNAHLADGVQRALGRQPRDFGDFARAAVVAGAWSEAA
ncbi:MAG: NmrA family transcriptional regulator, partial [Hyphomicrobiales bacterium]|nr:NmrA family transcriptional regulator [Hyphomicrobiales bacterium]